MKKHNGGKMKNYILFIIDSLNYSHLKDSKIDLMPYLRSLEKEELSCSNMFSQAPYTEAAVMDIYCGQNVLDNGGYFFRFKNSPKTIFEAMQEKGFITYFNSFQPQCYPSSLRRGVDYLYYNVGFDQSALWAYRLSHYAVLLKSNELTENDYENIYDVLDDNFKEWIRFIDNIENDDDSVSMIKGNASTYDSKLVREKVNDEINLYKNNKRGYVEDLLNQGTSHNFFKIMVYNQDLKISDRSIVEKNREVMMPTFRKIRKLSIRLNLKNAFGKIIKIPYRKFITFIKNPNIEYAKDFVRSILNFYNYILDDDLYDRVSNDYDSFKNAPSAMTHINHYIEWAKKHKGDDKPHFACIHVDDIHNPEEFFTYDSDDISLIEREMKEANEILDNLPKDYYGNITHDLSLKYIDGVIKYFIEELKTNDLYEDTSLVICADHGFSFSGNPIRDSFVVNLFLENYRIPFIITGTDNKKRINEYCCSKDIPATMCSLVDNRIPKEFTGNNVLDSKTDRINIIEYCGGGCPDISRRELKIAAFDNDYFVGTLCRIDDVVDSNITEIYDLLNDPYQKNNLVGKEYNSDKVDLLIMSIKERRAAIKKDLMK